MNVPAVSRHRACLKYALEVRCEYFRALLYGGLEESKQSEITLDVSSTAFKHLLRYIYTGSLELKDMEVDDILTLLGLVHQYGITAFVKAISDYLYGVLTVKNSSFDSVTTFRLWSSVGTFPLVLVRPQPVSRTVALTGTAFSRYSTLCTSSENCTGCSSRIKPMSLWNWGRL
uniref:BTB domain-containing protein n=1 Tax=Anopheles merus TaxID=30066 RepID=A0A182VKZ1_ANOME